MITCVYQPLPLTGSIRDSSRISGPLNMNNNRNCLVKVHKDSKRVIVSRFTEGGKYSREKVKVELIPTSIELINKKIEQLGLLNNNNNNDDNDNDNADEDSKPSISETCGLSLSELEAMATRQARLLENQEQLLAAKSQRLRFLKNGGGGDAEKLQKIRDKWATQEERLRKLRAIRGKVQTSKSTNSILSSDLESLKAVFNEKEKELSLAVAHVEELSKQLEELRRGGKNDQMTGQQTEKELEVDRLRRELNYRQKLRDAQATRVQAQRAALGLRHDEIIKVDRRIAELQERLHRKRLLNHQLASTLKHQEIVDDFIPNKNDPKYQTLPYNTKLFSPFSGPGKQHQNQQEMDNNGLPSPQLQMQIHHSESQLKRDLHGGPNVLNHTFSNGFQQQQQQQQQQKYHQQQLQQHHNAKLMSSSVLQSQIQQQSISTNNSNQYPVSSTIVSNGLQMVHSTQANSNVSWGKAIPLSSTSGDHQQYQNKIIKNSVAESQEYNFESSFSQNQNSSISSSSIGLENHQNQNDGAFRAGVLRPTLPPKPSKPTPPPRQTYDAFSYSPQRSSETTIQDRTELPIKPKPLFLVQERKKNYSSAAGSSSNSNSNISGNLNASSSSSSGGETTSGGAGSLLGDSAKDNSVISSIKNNNSAASASSSPATNANTNTTVRVSINRRIQMPPDFFFPESDPPPSDLLLPEITTQAPTSTTTLTTTTTTSTSVCDSVDAAVNSHPSKNNLFSNSNYNNQNSSSSQPEEYTLPDLFSSSDSNTLALALDGGNVIKDSVESSSAAEHKIDTCTDLRKPNLTLTEPLGNKSKSLADNQNNQNQANQVSEENDNQNMNVKKCENSISLMEIHIEPESPKENVQKELTSESQLDALESNVDSGCGNSSNSPEREDSTSDTSNSSNSLTLSSSAANVVKRVKKGNLKSANRDHLPVGRRVSFDPLALLLDASLEGELDLVIKTAGDVGNPSAANDEGITALHNAICASHPEVVKFLVEFGCDVNAADSDGWTPLHCAASCNNAGMVKFLVERGACIFATTLSDQETAADKCEEKEDGYGPCSDYLYSIQEKLGIMNNGAVYAVFDYEAHNPDELTFREGDRLVVLRKGDEVEREWWWTQNENNEQGYIPRNLLGLYPRVMPQRHNNPE